MIVLIHGCIRNRSHVRTRSGNLLVRVGARRCDTCLSDHRERCHANSLQPFWLRGRVPWTVRTRRVRSRKQIAGMAPPSSTPQGGAAQPSTQGTVAPLLYPMYLMPMQTLQGLERMITSQELLSQDKLLARTPEMQGKVTFISHQWTGFRHQAGLTDSVRRAVSGNVH